MFGLKEKHIEAIGACFARFPAIQEVVIFGSRAKGTYKTGSDIDLTIIDDTLSLSDISRLEAAMDDLILPYTFDISLKRKITNPDLIEHIDRTGQLFYKKKDTGI